MTTVEAKKLTQEERDNIPSALYAVPETEQLPINDVSHTKMAWNMLEKTKGLSDEQKSKAKGRILRRAHKLGIDTSKWSVEESEMDAAKVDAANDDCDVEAFSASKAEPEESAHASFQGMAIDMPTVEDHPNRIPFSGVLTRIDEPSDNPLGGSDGKRVVIPKDVAQTALPSLLGMAIDFQDDLSGHDPQQKIGLITSADIEGNEIHISGFFYGADYPVEVKRIQAEKSRLGFSYEAQVKTKRMNDGLLMITQCVFTGAAVLYKNKAAYTTTSLTAKADEDIQMTTEIMDALKAMTSRFDSVEAQLKEVKASGTAVQANSVMGMVEPHAKAMHALADGMEKAGIGLHAKSGHVANLRGMANHMMAEAATGKMPHVYQTSDFYSAGADKETKVEASAEVKQLVEIVSTLATKFEDLEKAKFSASANTERKTLSPAITRLLANNGITAGTDSSEKHSIDAVDKALASKGLDVHNRIASKLLMRHHNMIQGDNN